MIAPARRHRPWTGLAAALLLLVAMGAVAGPVLAKEGLMATLDAPVPRDMPGGTVLLVGMTVIVRNGSQPYFVDGSPIYLKLVGAVDSSWALGTQDGPRGHYVMRIPVPAGGVRSVEVGIHGTSDLPIVQQPVAAPVAAPGATPMAGPSTIAGWTVPAVIAAALTLVVGAVVAMRAMNRSRVARHATRPGD